MQWVRVKDPIYHTELLVVVNDKHEDFADTVLRLTGGVVVEDPSPACEAMFLHRDAGGYGYDFIWLSRFTGNAEGIALLTHEVFHFVSDMMIRRGIPPGPKTEEAYAYMLQYVIVSILSGLKSKARRKSKV